jgi:UDP-N-acetylmuramoyl-L-alanyl-D-glutamate--2,6-diaminopimelate ligase
MKLKDLLRKIEYTYLGADGIEVADPGRIEAMDNTAVSSLVLNSADAVPGSLFCCIKGANADGHAYAADAVSKGAAAILFEKGADLKYLDAISASAGKQGRDDPVVIAVDDTKKAVALAAAVYYGEPAGELTLIGVTGTKGKTTSTHMIRDIMAAHGCNAGVIGTLGVEYNDIAYPLANTTPNAVVLHGAFREMADAGVDTVIMEVSSQALKLDRVYGVHFDIGVFTNISPDHIGPAEHGDFAEYLECKAKLFSQCDTGVVNGDDPHIAEIVKDASCRLFAFGLDPGMDLYAEDIELVHTPGELGIKIDTGGAVKGSVHVPEPGRFSVYNALCAMSVCVNLGATPDDIIKALRDFKVKGRIEMVKVSDDFTLLIDYAHNAVALESILTTLREYEPSRLVCLFGCGGNRSRARRFEMGEVSGRLADFTIITSDNPRYEEPEDIIGDIVTGIEKTDGEYITITDRREAIAYAIHNGQKGDIIVLAGKGHEDYQEIKGKKYPMDERQIISGILGEDRRKG